MFFLERLIAQNKPAGKIPTKKDKLMRAKNIPREILAFISGPIM